jgi:hypothetical protein
VFLCAFFRAASAGKTTFYSSRISWDVRQLKTLGMQFATEGFEVHLLDLRNHGRSFHAEFSLMIQDILSIAMVII